MVLSLFLFSLVLSCIRYNVNALFACLKLEHSIRKHSCEIFYTWMQLHVLVPFTAKDNLFFLTFECSTNVDECQRDEMMSLKRMLCNCNENQI